MSISDTDRDKIDRYDRFRVVQPWGRNKATQSTTVGEFPSAAAAFAEIDTLAERMMQTGAPADAVELVVVDPLGQLVHRRGA